MWTMNSAEYGPAVGLSRGHGREDAAKLVESIVAAAFGVIPDAMRTASRGRARVAFARQVAMYLAHTRLGLSSAEAGEYYRRDRTTAAHACRRVEDLREDLQVDTLLDCLERTVDLIPALAEGTGGCA
jgi:chromosomal replication initiation ATPase DnaA